MTVLVNPPFQQQFIRRAEIILTNAQIKALPTTGIEIIPAPGIEKVIILLSGFMYIDTTAGLYTNLNIDASYIWIRYADDSFNGISNFFESAFSLGVADKTITAVGTIQFGDEGNIEGSTYTRDVVENKAALVGAVNGASNFTGGHILNKMKIIVYYTIENL